jgi:hypothetical protein
MRFITSWTNQRGGQGQSGVGPGQSVHTRTWSGGVKVTPRVRPGDSEPEQEEFDLYLTTGSTGVSGVQWPDRYLGTVKCTAAHGPVFVPADQQ